MSSTLPWLIVLACGAAIAALAAGWALLRRPAKSTKPLPLEWSLTPRPVFSADERRVYRQLKEALPHHVILSKLPLVRFCQPVEAKEVRYWFELLGAIHVTFAICSPNGRVLAAVDIDSERGGSSRSLQIKQSVLGACRVRYLRCPLDKLPSAAELQLLVPYSNSNARARKPPRCPARTAGGAASRTGPLRSTARRRTRRRAAAASGRIPPYSTTPSSHRTAASTPRPDRKAPVQGRRGPQGFASSRPFGESAFAEALSSQSHYPG